MLQGHRSEENERRTLASQSGSLVGTNAPAPPGIENFLRRLRGRRKTRKITGAKRSDCGLGGLDVVIGVVVETHGR